VFVYPNKEELYKKFPEEKTTNAWTYKDGSYNYVMVVTKDLLMSTLAHESLHITNQIFDFHGVKIDTKNDEHQAYFLTWVFEEVEKVLKKC